MDKAERETEVIRGIVKLWQSSRNAGGFPIGLIREIRAIRGKTKFPKDSKLESKRVVNGPPELTTDFTDITDENPACLPAKFPKFTNSLIH
jgi:hypothetical protein